MLVATPATISTCLDQVAVRMHPGQALSGSEVHDALAIVQEKTIRHHEERSWPLLDDRFERLFEPARGSHLQGLHFHSQD